MLRSVLRWSLACLLLLVIGGAAGAAAPGPNDRAVAKDVTAYWKKNWPEQELAHVAKKTDCEDTEIDGPAQKGKAPKKQKACLIKADIYVTKGYRYLIYRDSFVYYVNRKLQSVQLGELQKAWKAGGVPAPTPEQAIGLLSAIAAMKLNASDIEMNVVEMGVPRIHGELFRVSMLVDFKFTRDGKRETREKALATLQSDGGDWQVVPDLDL